MRVDPELVLRLRNDKSWSQEELSIASGLNIRTIQRIESEATISLQSKKALASAFRIDVRDLDYREPAYMKTYEYKSVPVPFEKGLFSKKGTTALDELLNAESRKGWRLKQILTPTDMQGMTTHMVAILEKETSN